ncbi:MAG: gp436 family protein, partial [Trebonia sp.]
MAYAGIADMVERYGQVEMIRLTTPAEQDMDTVQPEPVLRALEEASALIDGYLRRRYQVPLELVPAEVRRACCILARFDLATGDNREASERAVQDRKDTMAWLTQISRGDVLLPLAEVKPGDESYAQVQTRRGAYGDRASAY